MVLLTCVLLFVICLPTSQILWYRLGESEKQLEDVTDQQEITVRSLVKLVKENGKILAETKSILKAEAFQQIMKVILDSDRNRDASFSKREVKVLTFRLNQLPGIKVHKEKFQEQVSKTDGSIEMVVDLVSELYNDDIPEEDKFIEVDTEALRQ